MSGIFIFLILSTCNFTRIHYNFSIIPTQVFGIIKIELASAN